jgi:hypothetical protein
MDLEKGFIYNIKSGRIIVSDILAGRRKRGLFIVFVVINKNYQSQVAIPM